MPNASHSACVSSVLLAKADAKAGLSKALPVVGSVTPTDFHFKPDAGLRGPLVRSRYALSKESKRSACTCEETPPAARGRSLSLSPPDSHCNVSSAALRICASPALSCESTVHCHSLHGRTPALASQMRSMTHASCASRRMRCRAAGPNSWKMCRLKRT